MKHKLCVKQNNRMEIRRKETGIRLKVHLALKTTGENKATMNKGETALVQTEEKHPHFAKFEIKVYQRETYGVMKEADDRGYRILLRRQRSGVTL